MKRRDYELNSMSLENVRPFYDIKVGELSLESKERNINEYQSAKPVEKIINHEMEFLKNKISSSLLINKTIQNLNESEDQSLITSQNKLKSGKGIKLPQIREKLTLHITTQGTKILDEKR